MDGLFLRPQPGRYSPGRNTFYEVRKRVFDGRREEEKGKGTTEGDRTP